MKYRRRPADLALAIVLLATLAGFLLRAYHLDAQSYWMDEGYTTLATMTLLSSGTPTLPSGTTYQCGAYCALTLPIVKLFGINEFTMRIVATLAGTLMIPLIYFVTKRLFSIRVALLAMYFTTFSYWQIAWSRQARWYTLLALAFWLAIYLTLRATSASSARERTLATALALLTTLLAIASHPLGLLLPFALACVLLADPSSRARTQASLQRIRTHINTHSLTHIEILALLTGTALTFLTVWKLAHLASIVTITNTFSYYASFLLREYTLMLILASSALLLTFLRSDKSARAHVLLLISIVLLYLIPLSFGAEIIAYRYLFLITPALFILGAVGADMLTKQCSRTLRLLLLASIFAIFFFVPMLARVEGVTSFRESYDLESDPQITPTLDTSQDSHYHVYTPQPDWRMAYDAIAVERQQNDIIIASHPHFTYIYAGEAGYWFPIDYGVTKLSSIAQDAPRETKDRYVGALPISSVSALESLTAEHHGFIVFDSQARDGRIPDDIQSFIDNTFPLVLFHETNQYSKIWVYRF